MVIKPIKNDHDYKRALVEIDKLINAKLNTADGDRLDVLANLVCAWEEKHHAVNPPDVLLN